MRSALLVTALLLLSPAAPAGEGGLTVDPPELTVGLFFHGADLAVHTDRSEGDRAVFRLLGPADDVELKVRDRVWGFLWTNTGDVSFHDVPAMLLVQGVPELPSDAALERAGLSSAALRDDLLGADPAPIQTLAFDEMEKLFEKRGTWAAGGAAAPRAAGGTGTVFHLPPDLPTGEFRLTVTFFDGDRVVGEDQARLVVRRTGFVDGVIRLARDHGFWYGMIAIVMAVLAGLATGYVFGLKKMRKE